MAEFCIVGGVCADVSARPFAEALGRDSNPSRITMTAGGVGFNIASRLAELGHEPRLLCTMGEDPFAAFLRAEAEKANVRLISLPSERSGVYICINDAEGDMQCAYSDLEGTELNITPEALKPHLDTLNSCAACVLDGNLTAEAIAYLAENVTAKLFADPVSTKKAMRVLPVLPRLFAIKPNIFEARAMTGRETPEDCAKALVDMGCGSAFVSCGAEGIYYADKTSRGHAPSERVTGVTTGAGDAAGAMLISMLTAGASAKEAAEAANRFAAERIRKMGQNLALK